MLQYIIDHFEEKYAICEDENKEMIQIPKKELPPGAKEGDILCACSGILHLDESSTSERRSQIRRKMMDLFE